MGINVDFSHNNLCHVHQGCPSSLSFIAGYCCVLSQRTAQSDIEFTHLQTQRAGAVRKGHTEHFLQEKGREVAVLLCDWNDIQKSFSTSNRQQNMSVVVKKNK